MHGIFEQNDAVGLAELIRRGETTPDELLDEALKRVEALNPQINAVTMLQEGVARRLIAEGSAEGRAVPAQGSWRRGRGFSLK